MFLQFHTDDQAAPLQTRHGLEAFLASNPNPPTPLGRATYQALPEAERIIYDRARTIYISGGIVIQTPQLAQARRILQQCFAVNVGRNSGHAGLILNGDSTIGKTETTKALMRLVHTQYSRAYPDFAQAGRIPIVYISVPAASNGKTLMKAFADFLGLPVATRESMGDIRARVVSALRSAGTQLIVVDELQNLVGRTAGLGESVDVLKNLHNELSATFVYAGYELTSSNLLTGTRGQQLRGRFSVLNMERVNVTEPADRRTWKGLLLGFEKKLTLHDQTPGSLLAHTDYLFERTSGSIGSLARLLISSASELINSGPDALEMLTPKIMDNHEVDRHATAERANILARKKKADTPRSMESLTGGEAAA